MRKGVKRIIVAVCALLVLGVAAGFVAGNFFYNLALNPETDRTKVFEAEQNEVEFGAEYETEWTRNRDWFKEMGYSNVAMESYDGLTLYAYMLKNEVPTDNWVIISHGYLSGGWAMLNFSRAFYDMGYNLLMPDARGNGRSEGHYVGMGWHDRYDLLDWIDLLNAQHAPRNIVLYGVSMGGATVMMASGEALPDNVRAIVEDCGYTSALDEFTYQLDSLFGMPAFPLMNFTSVVTRIRAGFWLEEADAVKQVEKSTTPMLFIHGEKDAFVPSDMVYRAYEAASCEKELYVVPEAGHGTSSATVPEEYWAKVEQFVEAYLV